MKIRKLGPDDATQFQQLRLAGLVEAPTAFSSSYEEEVDRSIDVVASRLEANDNRAVFGAFDQSNLVGVIGVVRESHQKLAHKAFIWGVYVEPGSRNKGLGKQLVAIALTFAFEDLGVRQVNLGVNQQNLAAIAVYEALGFQTFGIEKDFLKVDDKLHNELHMVCFRNQLD